MLDKHTELFLNVKKTVIKCIPMQQYSVKCIVRRVEI